jgi:hypothetical protein
MVPVIAGLTRNLLHQGLTHAGRAGFAIQLTGKAEQRNTVERSVPETSSGQAATDA